MLPDRYGEGLQVVDCYFSRHYVVNGIGSLNRAIDVALVPIHALISIGRRKGVARVVIPTK
jgi:hypothetical protein